ncbi:MAG: hypothetical protein AAGF23_08485 [Acidobacteriota bacterium]
MASDVSTSHLVDGAPRARPVTQWPEPSRLWIASAPRTWRLTSELWCDLAIAELGGLQKPAVDIGLPDLDTAGVDDTIYLPPVDDSLTRAREDLAGELVSAGVPVLLQVKPGQTAPDGVIAVYDLLRPLLDGEPERLAEIPKGTAAIWPLIPGISDYPEVWDEGLDYCQAVGVDCVQPIILDLSPVAKRKLAEGRSEEVFDALFHSRQDGRRQRAFASLAAERGFKVFLPRPEASSVVPRVLSNRKIAEQLALAGELWLRLGRPVGPGQALLRAARGAESTNRDLAGLAREKNLKVLDWLDNRSRDIAEQFSEHGTSARVERLLGQYLGTVEDDDGAEDPPDPR